jgi:hypothetical protein
MHRAVASLGCECARLSLASIASRRGTPDEADGVAHPSGKPSA